MSGQGYIAKLVNVRKHPDPETHSLQLAECFGNQIVVGLDAIENQVGIYFPADLRLSEEFVTKNNLLRKIDPVTKKNIGGLFDDNRKVRTQKLRREKSDGFFCPLSYVAYTGIDINTLIPGVAFTELNGHKICEKFVTVRTMGARREKKEREKTKYPLFHEHIDTEQLAYRMDELKPGMFLVLTEKLHGTSQRTANTIEEKPIWYAKYINGFFKKTIIQPIRGYNYACGTRRVILKDFDNLHGFYKENEMFRKFAHENFLNKLRKGETVYYEVVGYAGEKTPMMPTCNNTKLNDKEFVKQYGKETTFKYGCKLGQHEIYVYRITMTNEDGDEVDLSWDDVKLRCVQMGVKHVPELVRIIYTPTSDVKDFIKQCDVYAEGASTIDPTHIREGVVVRADGSTWKAWKHKSFQFKVLEDIIKLTNDAVDIEEAQESVGE